MDNFYVKIRGIELHGGTAIGYVLLFIVFLIISCSVSIKLLKKIKAGT